MGILAVELAFQRMLTNAFVAADESDIVLSRSERVSDGAGGTIVQGPLPLASQKLRFQPRQDTGNQRTNANGQEVTPTYTLVGRYTADIERWDTFVKDGYRYEVVFVYENQQYEVKAEVAYDGEV